ncbi:hypothetical protein OAK48_04710 [Deltaproteobacteria bacterium]|nr:hypothetical protein [Deltaproteobacteria bacterium]
MAPSLPVSAHFCILKSIERSISFLFDHINLELSSRGALLGKKATL